MASFDVSIKLTFTLFENVQADDIKGAYVEAQTLMEAVREQMEMCIDDLQYKCEMEIVDCIPVIPNVKES